MEKLTVNKNFATDKKLNHKIVRGQIYIFPKNIFKCYVYTQKITVKILGMSFNLIVLFSLLASHFVLIFKEKLYLNVSLDFNINP